MTATDAPTNWRDFFAEGRGARLALICLGVWLNAADSLVTSTIMPTVGRALGGYAYFSWATAAYMVGAIFSGATAARLSARVGLRGAMIGAALVTAAGCAISALATDMIVLVFGRAVQGIGSGWILGACYAAIGAIFPERHLARIFGVMSAIWGVALVLGPLVGGAFAEGGHWRGLFWAFAGQCGVFMAAAWGLLPARRGAAATRAPWSQLALVLGGVGLIGAADLMADVRLALGLGLASIAVFIAAVRLPVGTRDSLFPRAAGDPSTMIGAGYLSFFALSAAAMGFGVYAPALLQKLYGLSPLASGYAAGMESFGWTVAALAVAGLAERWHGPVIRLGGLCIVVSLAALAVVMRAGPLAAILAAATLLGVGFGLSSGFASRRVIAAAGADEREVASAGINSVRLVGNAAGACLSGAIANLLGLGSGVSLRAAEAACVWLFALAVPVALLGAAGAWRIGVARAPET
jgi:MFS family permease